MTNIERFGKLKDDGEREDHKRSFVVANSKHECKNIHIAINTDDCDRKHALDFKKALIELWNSQKSTP